MVGTIKRLVKGRGFGFIRTDVGDVFFHRSVVRGKFEELQANQKVRIEVVKRDEGMAATIVEKV